MSKARPWDVLHLVLVKYRLGWVRALARGSLVALL